jgi:hypothetical protein
MNRRWLVIPLIWLNLAAVSLGATFYCDPDKGTPQGDGSAEKPWRTIEEVLSAKLVQLFNRDGTASNPAAPVKPGDTILLRTGWHGVIRIPTGFNLQPLTIAAQEGHKPQVGFVEVRDGANWVIKGLSISPSLAPVPLQRKPAHLVMLGEHGGDKCRDLVVEDCFIYSVLDSSAWTAADWMHAASDGIWLGRNGAAHVARNNFVLNTRFGISLCAADCIAEGNVVANFSADGMRATRDGQVIQDNVIKNVFVGARDGDDNHDDGIQAFLFNAGTGTLRNIVLRGNIIFERESDGLPWRNHLQGIGCFDGPLVGFTVENNVICVEHYHGVSLYDARGCTIRGNVCFARGDSELRPWIMLGQKKKQADGNTVRDNFAHSFNFKSDSRVTAGNNVPVARGEFQRKLAERLASINGKYGEMHAASGRKRLEASSNP